MMKLATDSGRTLNPEILDQLVPDDPRARRSRQDLHRIHRAMGTVSILRQSLRWLKLPLAPRRILEIGAGDGTLLLRLATSLHPHWSGASVTLIDQHNLISPRTRAAYRRLDLRVTVERADVIEWVRQPSSVRYDLCVATLFLHHFDDGVLATLLPALADKVNSIVVAEPRRGMAARVGSSLIGVLGVNSVTRSDAVTSVAAGFSGHELTDLWPTSGSAWVMRETAEFPFTHSFSAVRASAQAAKAVYGH